MDVILRISLILQPTIISFYKDFPIVPPFAAAVKDASCVTVIREVRHGQFRDTHNFPNDLVIDVLNFVYVGKHK